MASRKCTTAGDLFCQWRLCRRPTMQPVLVGLVHNQRKKKPSASFCKAEGRLFFIITCIIGTLVAKQEWRGEESVGVYLSSSNSSLFQLKFWRQSGACSLRSEFVWFECIVQISLHRVPLISFRMYPKLAQLVNNDFLWQHTFPAFCKE